MLVGRLASVSPRILTTIPSYSTQLTLMLINLCNLIDRNVRQFKWGSSQGKRKVHLVNWEVVTRGKEYGGSGSKENEEYEPSVYG